MTTGTRKTHDFCWINLMTPEAERARAFFGTLFGWTYREMPGVPGAQHILVGDRTAGALMDLSAPNMPPDIPPFIGVMVKVENADAAVAKVTSLGGSAEPVFDMLDNGRMAQCADPNGAVFFVWQAKKQHGIDVDSHAHGAPSWYETLTSDLGRATSFYAALFGWKLEDQCPVPGMTYTLFKLDKVPVGGAMQLMPEHMGDVPPHWGTSFAVTNADETARLAVELGATLCIPVSELAGVGRFALLKSPQGVSFHIVEWASFPDGAAS
ncbi:VOC family protein [Polyangium sorediatum]|uniref:VOC family protein n=1 Tax=Polyangium sorediatum TaxID=889274 RepID=A0ABT6P9R7_9BACT|nr:VOC family protein [Polyangium sorediatum]MDI1437012.1 VOC family protein [Polyangium sorediatum]